MSPTLATRLPPRSLSGIFVAGTDTGVGKTLVSTGLLRFCLRRKRPLLPFKPAESGCPAGRPQDAAALRAAAQRPDLTLQQICPFAFRPAVAPAAAAQAVGVRLTLPVLRRAALALSRGEPLLVESAGGLLSPYAPNLTAADLATGLGLPVLLIARNALGTINHTALAIAELRRRQIPLLALLLVTTKPERSLAAQRNAALIQSLTGIRPLASLPFFRRPTADSVANFFATSRAGTELLKRAGLAGQPRR